MESVQSRAGGFLVDGVVQAKQDGLTHEVGKGRADGRATLASLGRGVWRVLLELHLCLEHALEEADPFCIDTKELENRKDGRVRERGTEPFKVGANDGDLSAELGLHQDLGLQTLE